MISKYNEFLLEKEFNSIIDDIFRIVESRGVWTSPNTVECIRRGILPLFFVHFTSFYLAGG
jgi:hypothetical protein